MISHGMSVGQANGRAMVRHGGRYAELAVGGTAGAMAPLTVKRHIFMVRKDLVQVNVTNTIPAHVRAHVCECVRNVRRGMQPFWDRKHGSFRYLYDG